MDPIKTGELIRALRMELGMTQQQLAQRLHVGDKAVSKWERGAGCPDISLLPSLAEALGIGLDIPGCTSHSGRSHGNRL